MAGDSITVGKACGIETELGVIAPEHFRPRDAVEYFVRAAKQEWVCRKFSRNVGWDPTVRLLSQERTKDENDLRAHPQLKDTEWMWAGNRILDNGARFYLDCKHPEISTPTCTDPRMLVIWNRACYRSIEIIRKKFLENGIEFKVFRNNVALSLWPEELLLLRSRKEDEDTSMPPRETFACHLNITVNRRIDERELIFKDIPFFILLTPVVGLGKVGGDNGQEWADFQISQRADWHEDIANSFTTVLRAIHNTRDNPYARWKNFRRVHIICFDSNMLELPEYLKAGLCSILYMMMEDRELDNRFWIGNPVKAFRAISRDINLDLKLETMGHPKARPVTDYLKEYADLFWQYLDHYHPLNEILKDVVVRFRKVVDLLEAKNWDELRGKTDWVTKKFLIKSKLAKKGAGWRSPLAQYWDAGYSNNADDAFFASKIANHPETVRVSTDAEIEYAMSDPPPSRSRWITAVLDRYRERVESSDYWYRIEFKGRGEDERWAVYFEDPNIYWNEAMAGELLSLSFDEFVEAAKRIPFMRVAHLIQDIRGEWIYDWPPENTVI